MSTTPSYLGRFVWHDLMTTDLPAAKAFYTSVAGWGTEVWEGGGMPYTMWTVKGTAIGGMMQLPAEAATGGAPPHWLGYVGTPDIDATAAQVTALGGKVMVPPTPIPTVGKFAVVSDPYGAVFALFTPEKDAPGHEGMPEAGEFSWRELATRDLNGALDFYGKLFGWTLHNDMDMGEMGTYRVFARNGEMMGGMYVIPASMPMPPSWAYYIFVSDIDAAAARTTAGGGTIVQPIMDIPGGKIFMAKDPQGGFFAAHAISM